MHLPKRIKKRTTPLCFLPSGKLLCYHKGRLLVYGDPFFSESFDLPLGEKERFVLWSRLLTRLFRGGIRAGVAINDDLVLLSAGNSIIEYSLKNKRIVARHSFVERIRPLVFSKIESVPGFEDGIVFGGYLTNMGKKSVNVYKWSGQGKWDVVYRFAEGTINHVHNIIPDPIGKCLWIFTGDFGDAAAIWRATDNFGKVERVLYGDQRYRACVAYALDDGLVYATDSPLTENHIYHLDRDLNLHTISSIDGSCIYGCRCGDNLVFESTVEPSGVYKNKLDFLFCWKAGPGIKNRDAHLYVGTIQSGFQELYKEKKDCLPFVFQFGVFRFPFGDNPSNILFFQPTATVKNDQSLLAIDL